MHAPIPRTWVRGPALVLFLLLPLLLSPSSAQSCACGCGIFEVGDDLLYPAGAGGMFSLEYDFMNQGDNWSGAAAAPASANDDKLIRTQFVTLAGHYMVTRAWGVEVEAPYWDRQFRTSNDQGEVESFLHGALGDVRVRALYTGFSAAMTSGLSAGLKLPTGDFRYANFDRDTEIGSGSTDLLLGAWHSGVLTEGGHWHWSLEAQAQQPFAFHGDYRPGGELDATTALYRSGGHLGSARVSPLLQLIGSVRARDSGTLSNPDDSGYERLLAAGGVQASLGALRATFTAAVPLAERVNGNQLVAPAFLKLRLGHSF